MDSKMNFTNGCIAYFNAQYAEDTPYWSEHANLLVPLVGSYIPPGSRVLVIGCGEGRDAIFLARLGFNVVATEVAVEGLKKARKKADEIDVRLELLELDAHDSHEHLGEFDAILMMSVLQFLNPEHSPNRIEHFKSLVKPGGFFSVETFTVDDPLYIRAKESDKKEIAPFTIMHPERNYGVRFFEKGELRSYFSEWGLYFYHEGPMWDRPHGTQKEFHKHGIAQMIAQKSLLKKEN
jgi:SAM-dependent methyltransferase